MYHAWNFYNTARSNKKVSFRENKNRSDVILGLVILGQVVILATLINRILGFGHATWPP
jgi:hypothetical protein